MEDVVNHLFMASEDLKRVDHIIYVSLKYTKTVDMLRNGIDRMISTMFYLREHLLNAAYDKDLIESIPKIEKFKGELLVKLINLEEFDEFINFYRYMRNLIKQPYTKHHEFRKNMHMLVDDQESGEDIAVNVELILEYYNKLNDYVKLTKRILEENFFINQSEEE